MEDAIRGFLPLQSSKEKYWLKNTEGNSDECIFVEFLFERLLGTKRECLNTTDENGKKAWRFICNWQTGEIAITIITIV